MHKHQSQLVLLGSVALASLSFAQTTRPGDAPAAQDRQPSTIAQDSNVDSLMNVQKRFQQAVQTEVRTGAQKHAVTIDEGRVMISLLGDRGIIAGAPASGANTPGATGQAPGAAGQPNQPGTGDPNRRDPATPPPAGGGADAARPGAPAQPGTSTATADQQVLGVVVVSAGLIGKPMTSSGQPQDADRAAQDAGRNREGQAPTTSTTATTAQGSNGLVALEVRRSKTGGAQQVELYSTDGQVALKVQLIGSSATDAGTPREASAPRDASDKGTDAAAGGTADQKNPQNPAPRRPENPRPDEARTQDSTKAGAAKDWSIVYASIVHELCHEKK